MNPSVVHAQTQEKTTPGSCLLQTLMQSEGAVAYKTFKIVTRIKTLYRSYIAILYRVCNHVKLEICLFVMNFNSGGFSLRVVYCVVDIGYGLGRSITKWLKHKLRAMIGGPQFEQTNGRSGFPFSLRSVGGRLEFVARILGGFSEALQPSPLQI